MLLLITGAPGASKTSHVINKFMDEKQRPIFYYNIALNDEGKSQLGWMEFTQDQVLNWQNELPTNAILIVDECQRIWPVRPPSKPVPESCTAMETHRHQGVDIILITQHPGLIDSHIRKLVNEHFHYSRPFGMPFAVEYHSGSGVVSPDSRSELGQCTQSKRTLPKRVWPLYKSAEVHTHKAKVPKVIYVIVIAALLAVYFLWKFLSTFGQGSQVQQEAYQDASGTPYASQTAHAANSLKNNKHDDMSWSELLTPEVPGIPFTAPLYREEATKVASVPRVAGCMVISEKCTCYTQQGTKIPEMPDQVCRQYLSNPAFNHMRADSAEPERQTLTHINRSAPAQAHGEARTSAVLVRASSH